MVKNWKPSIENLGDKNLNELRNKKIRSQCLNSDCKKYQLSDDFRVIKATIVILGKISR